MVSRDRIFRIGTSDVCEIVIAGGAPANTIWAQLTVSDTSMHLLTVVDPAIRCSVNGNVVSKQYWVHANDRIEIEGRVLNWAYINGDSNNAFLKQPKKQSALDVKKLSIILAAACALIAALVFGINSNSGVIVDPDPDPDPDPAPDVSDTLGEAEQPNVLEIDMVVEPEQQPVPAVKPAKKQETNESVASVVPERKEPVEETEREAESPSLPDVDEKPVQNKKPVVSIAVSPSMSVSELWAVVKNDDRNSYALYYLAKYYGDSKLDVKDDKSARNFWKDRKSDGDLKKYLGDNNNNISLTLVRLTFVLLARAKANMPEDIDESIKKDILDRLKAIKDSDRDKYKDYSY